MLGLLLATAFSLDNGLGLTPPMGWMTWEQYHCTVDCKMHPKTCISEGLLVDTIDAMAADGWLELGYEYVNIDDCWMGSGRDKDGKLYGNTTRFPHGIKWLADYAHSKKVKLGIYNDYGTLTCGRYTGSLGHLLKDARTFAEWGIDMLKMDGCNSKTFDMYDAYPGMAFFMNKTGRPIMFSCSWPAYDQGMNYSMLPPFCNLWRNWNDIQSNWHSISAIINKWGNSPHWAEFAGPGHWNDPDQIVIGMEGTKLTEAESRSQFGIWSILAAPLIMTNHLKAVPAWAKTIMQNKEVIAVDQDKLGKQGKRVTEASDDGSVWVRELENGEFAIGLLNFGDAPRDITVKWSQFSSTVKKLALRDLWEHKDLGVHEGQYTAKAVASHDTVMLRGVPQN
jgi:alpha-N-acetylgalactosaminidase